MMAYQREAVHTGSGRGISFDLSILTRDSVFNLKKFTSSSSSEVALQL
jgi:hypothetical protein